MLRLDLWDYSDEYILVNGRITVEGDNNDKTRNKKLILKKKNAPFRSCISNINSKFIDYVEDIDIVMPIYNLLE